jgi:DNA-binding NarL/FixJ family response regulator
VKAVGERSGPIRLALVDDYEVVLVGVAHLFDDYRDRIHVVELDAGEPVTTDVDIALFDTFAQHEADSGDIEVLVANRHAARVAVYTWNFAPHLVDAALRQGASGYLSKTLTAAELVDALERIHAGEVVVSAPPPRRHPSSELEWPGRSEGLTARESEILALVTQARTNAEIAEMTYLSVNTVKGYVQNVFRKIGVRTRTEAALWGIAHGFAVDGHRIDTWRSR